MSFSSITRAQGQSIFVVGDIHGCATELGILIRHLQNKTKITPKDLVVFVGDYIDRGPESKKVIDLLLEFRSSHENILCLEGNHEEMFLDFLREPDRLAEPFLGNGGLETLRSYGISIPILAERGCEWLEEQLGEQHLEFFRSLHKIVLVDDFVIVHAGLRPTRPLEAQLDEDIFWIRDEFILNTHCFGKTIVFGHTPFREVFLNMPFKIGIDTGLVYGNALSCIELRSGNVLKVARGGASVESSRVKLRSRFNIFR